MEIIKCINLGKTYGKEKSPALSNLNITVEKNSVYGFLGPNGAGKTTTVKILTGLMKPSEGEFFIDGIRNETDSVKLRQKIGYLGQEPKMYTGMKAKQLLCFVGEIFGQSALERSKRADELLEMSGLKDAANKRISNFSGGMLQRLGIAQALMGKPQVLFLDEPASALDPIGRKEVLEFIAGIKNECTVFMSTHILSDVERVCDTVAIINKGKLIIQEETALLKKRYSDKLLKIVFSSEKHTADFESMLPHPLKSILTETNANSLIFHPENPEQDKQFLLKLIAEKEFSIESFETKTADLEDVFVKLIGGDKHE
jgi:ABC-2 type transport system ATP-binding protein